MPGIRVREAARQLEDTKTALALAEAKMQEMREIVYELLAFVGGPRRSCEHCEAPVIWVAWRGVGDAIPFNIDGSQHWPRCRGAARPVAAEGTTA